MKSIAILVLAAFLANLVGCAGAPSPAPVVPTWEQKAADATKLPPQNVKKPYPAGTIVAVSKGGQAPFDGILFTEPRATDAGQLRIDYDELYAIAAANQRLYVQTAGIADKELADADRRIRSLEPTWFDRHKLAIGFIAGVVLTGAFTVGLMAATKHE